MRKLINALIFLKRNLAPRYRLTLDTYDFDLVKKKMIYSLKVFNEFTPIDLSYDQIQKDEHYLYSINPHDLIKINSIEKDINNSQILLTELLRNNTYKIKDDTLEAVLTGNEICNNPLLIERMKKMDIHRVSYATGLNDGRALAKEFELLKASEPKVIEQPKLYLVK